MFQLNLKVIKFEKEMSGMRKFFAAYSTDRIKKYSLSHNHYRLLNLLYLLNDMDHLRACDVFVSLQIY